MRAAIQSIPEEAAKRGVFPEDTLRQRFLKVIIAFPTFFRRLLLHVLHPRETIFEITGRHLNRQSNKCCDFTLPSYNIINYTLCNLLHCIYYYI